KRPTAPFRAHCAACAVRAIGLYRSVQPPQGVSSREAAPNQRLSGSLRCRSEQIHIFRPGVGKLIPGHLFTNYPRVYPACLGVLPQRSTTGAKMKLRDAESIADTC
ncbi:MAG: hypothetical protein KBT28_06785, partial [Bacteroidales bacterium]|nr:hypothetical protein [Candidatus Colimorpha merdihippi]